MNKKRRINRRTFIKTAAGGVSAALAATGCSQSESQISWFGNPAKKPPSDRVTVGVIGTGDLAKGYHIRSNLLNRQADRCDIAAVCDVDRNHRNEAAKSIKDKTGRKVGIYEDFRDLLDRKDIDAVFIVTPDHWHALIAIAAMEAGKDVYCQKPLTLTIEEGRAMVNAARRYGTVFQTGSQQRSDDRFRQACELVRNGKLGKLEKITTHIGGIDAGSWAPTTAPPPELNWDFWLGPAPWHDYTRDRCHYQFRWYSDYSGGKMTDWGAHHNDIAQWALGTDESGPVTVEAKGTFHENGPHDVAGEFEVTHTYANGVKVICQSNGDNGVNFYGENGHIFVRRGKITASDPDILKTQLGPNDTRLEVSEDHHKNFFDCIATRERPICDVEVGHRSVTVCHLGNIALRLGRKLNWDPVAERFVNDDEANRLISKPMRGGWHL